MLTVDMVLRGDEKIASHADQTPYADGGSRYVRIENEAGDGVILIFTGSDEDINVSVQNLMGHLERIKTSLPITIR
jgi:hypothetical protein